MEKVAQLKLEGLYLINIKYNNCKSFIVIYSNFNTNKLKMEKLKAVEQT